MLLFANQKMPAPYRICDEQNNDLDRPEARCFLRVATQPCLATPCNSPSIDGRASVLCSSRELLQVQSKRQQESLLRTVGK
jgi:hypothetical protein